MPESKITTEGWSEWVSERGECKEGVRETREVTVEGGGWRSWVSDSGIRQLGQAAWLEADLFVHLSWTSHFAAAEATRSWLHSLFSFHTKTLNGLLRKLFFLLFSFGGGVWTLDQTCISCPLQCVGLLFLCESWHCCSNGGLPEEEPPLSAVGVQEEGWVQIQVLKWQWLRSTFTQSVSSKADLLKRVGAARRWKEERLSRLYAWVVETVFADFASCADRNHHGRISVRSHWRVAP